MNILSFDNILYIYKVGTLKSGWYLGEFVSDGIGGQRL